jgi:hypothetical protein
LCYAFSQAAQAGYISGRTIRFLSLASAGMIRPVALVGENDD